MPITEWDWGIEEAALRYRPADVLYPSVEQFNCGDDWCAAEVNRFVRAARWGNKPNLTALEFGLDGETVGFAFLRLSEMGHPHVGSSDAALYQVILVTGINLAFQRRENPGSSQGERLSTTMFRAIEAEARSAGAVGLHLQVRVENGKARRFYERVGFEDDPGGEFLDGKQAIPTLVMRKQLR